jgi:hypothetical protein
MPNSKTSERPLKITQFTAYDAHGKGHTWAFWFDPRYSHWFLRACDGYERCLEHTWQDSLPRMRMILASYDMTADLS